MALPLSKQTILLNDGSIATIFPVWDVTQLPLELVASLCNEYNAEVDRGCSFPETQRMLLETFERNWFSSVSGIVIAGDFDSSETDDDIDLLDNHACLGSFYLAPCYAGRSAHICSANFLVKSKFRKRGVGTAMAQCFMRWAVQLGYDQALFQLVYDCNIAACRILSRLDFKILTTLKAAGILKGFDHPVDAFIFGRSLNSIPIKSTSMQYSTVSTPAMSTPAMSTPAMSTPAMSTPAMSTPAMSTPAMSTPAVGTPNPDAAEFNHHEMLAFVNSSSSNRAAIAMDGPNLTSETSMSNQQSSNSKTETGSVKFHLGDNLSTDHNQFNKVELRWLSNKSRKHTVEFDNVRVYLINGVYPPNVSRTERTRIRSRSRSYFIQNGELMCKRTGTPVVSDPDEQFIIADHLHQQNHNGINKLQKEVLDRYFWQGVRETITKVIKACNVCRNGSQPPSSGLKQSEQPTQSSIDSKAIPNGRPLSTSEPANIQNNSAFLNQDIQKYTNLLNEPQDPGSVVYLLPEHEDDEYVPDDSDYDMGLREGNEEFEEDDDLFRDDDDDEWNEDDDDDDDEYENENDFLDYNDNNDGEDDDDGDHEDEGNLF